MGQKRKNDDEDLESTRMRKSNPTIKAWEDGSHETIDILARIFRQLNLIDLVSVSQICHSWRLASSDPSIWSVLDLGNLKSNFIYITVRPFIWADSRSDRKLTYILRIAMALSHGNITFMIFNYNLYMKDKHLSIIAEGCPNLKRLVLPAWNCLTKGAMCQAIERWSKLESLTMPSIGDPDILVEIGNKCKNFSQLKVMGSIDMRFASKIAGVRELRVLSLRCCVVTKEALLLILDDMAHLEELNIAHCLIIDGPEPQVSARPPAQIIRKLDQMILEKASPLRAFFHCQDYDTCTACKRMIDDVGIMRWYRYEDWFWRQDEVSVLDLGYYGNLFDGHCASKGFQV